MAAGLALAASAHAVISASPQGRSVAGGDVDIIVDGAPQPPYAHEGRWYVEARKGREYAIRLRNPYAVRVAVALSVDGLNTIDARETTAAEARKWVLGPYETVTISGWQTSQTRGAPLRIHNRGALVRSGARQDRQPGRDLRCLLQGARACHHARTIEGRKRSREAGPAVIGAAEQEAASAEARRADDEFAATGMGRRTGHTVTQVWLDLEDTPAQTVNMRYEFRPELVRLGILPPVPTADPLQRRERARGFEPGFCPEPPRQR